MKLWDKGHGLDKFVEAFTVGNDRDLDLELAVYDVLGSEAHARMLCKIGILSESELDSILSVFQNIRTLIENGAFSIDPGMEDVHSQIEKILTDELGEAGKKIHTGRSRNDQVLLDIRLLFRDRILIMTEKTRKLALAFLQLSEQNSRFLMPGYTHSQIAMVSSFGMWFGSFAEALADDILTLKNAHRIINKNPLGSAAGYGSSFPIDREMTTELLGFDDLCYNSMYAQFGRGKVELVFSDVMASLAFTISRFAADVCLFCNQNFRFVYLPDALTTGSSIMPHKKNPDVFELIRAQCHQIESVPSQIRMICANLMSGYHRDYQMLKEVMFPAITKMTNVLDMMNYCLPEIKVNTEILKDERYAEIYSVESVNQLVMKGMPFREAYREIAGKIKEGSYMPYTKIEHTHTGSIGNLGIDQIRKKILSA